MLTEGTLPWRLIVGVLVLLTAMAWLGQCLFHSDSEGEARNVGAARVGDSDQVRPPSEEELLEHYQLGEADLDPERPGYPRDPAEEIPPGAEERFAETLVDEVGPPVPAEAESRFQFDIEEVLGPHDLIEALGGSREGNLPSEEGDGLDSEMLVVTVRGYVRNLTTQDCRRLVLKASYRGKDGTIHALGEAVVRDIPAQSRRGRPFEVQLTDWPPSVEAPQKEGFQLYELRSRWNY